MPRQTQRIHKKKPRDDFIVDDDDESEDDAHRRNTAARNPWIELSDEEQSKYVKRLVRYFLARNYLKAPVKRNEISKALLNGKEGRLHPKITKGALEKAVAYMKGKFGFQILEVRRMTRASQSQRSQRTQTARMTQSQTSSGPIGEKAYIIVNTIDEDLRSETKDTTELAMFGFVIVIAALILLEPGAKLGQSKLYKSLDRLGLCMSGREENNHKDLGNLKWLLEKTLTSQWYFEREREAPDVYNYLLGPRLLQELSEEHLLAFISAVYGTPLDDVTRTELKMRLASMHEASDEDSD